jgi:hypothetical protein
VIIGIILFICDAQIIKGTIVNLKAANVGVVEIADAVGDFPIGVVSVGNKAIDERITVKTPFVAVETCIADGGVDYGELVSASGIDGDGRQKAATLAETGYAFGIALSTADTGNEVTIGVFRMPVSAVIGS